MRLIFRVVLTTLCCLLICNFLQGQKIRTMDEQGYAARILPNSAVAQSQPAASYQAADWQALGPFGGDVADVAASPINSDIVLAGLDSGALYRSVDGAATWTEVSALSGVSIYDIEFTSLGKAFLGTIDSVWTSDDAGLTWSQVNLNIGPNDQVLEVTVDPGNDQVIWIGVAEALGNQTVNILVSTDGGASWADKTPPMGTPLSGAAIAVDPTDSGKIVAGFQGGFGGGAVWVSADGGNTWTNRSAGLPGNPMNDAAHDGTRMLICGGQLFGSQDVGVYESTNDGATWNPLHDGTWPSLAINDLEIDPNNSDVILAVSSGQGVFRTGDGGGTWTFGLGGSGSMALNEASFEPGSSTDLYLGATSNAVWKSTDGGQQFNPSSTGIGQLNVVAVAGNAVYPEELAIAFEGLNSGGVYTSDNAGLTWSLANLPGTRYSEVGFAPDGTLLAISSGPTTIAPEGLYRRDSGGVWTGIGPDQGNKFESDLLCLRFSKNNPDLILSGGADFGVAGFEATVWYTDDAGSTWTKAYEGPAYEDVTDIRIIEDGTDQVMLASYTDFGNQQIGGALRSVDGGLSWADSSSGLAAGRQCTSLSQGPEDLNTFYVSDDDYGAGGVYKTVDGGVTWASTGFADRAMRVVANPYVSGVLYIAQFNTGIVWESTDGGATFHPYNTGLANAGSPRDLVFAYGRCELLLATGTGSYGSGIDCPLMADQHTFAAGSSGTINLALDAGSANMGRNYLILGSLSGTEPGIALPGGMTTLPLVWDGFTDLVLSKVNTAGFVDFMSGLDSSGKATARIVSRPVAPSKIGRVMHYAFVLQGAPWDFVSNPVAITFVP